MTAQKHLSSHAKRWSFDGGSQPRTLAAALGYSVKDQVQNANRTAQFQHHEQINPKAAFGRDGGAFRTAQAARLKSLALRFATRS